MLALLVGLVLLLLLPHPWNGVGFAVAMVWEIVTILYCLWWSQRQAPQVGTSTLLGLGAVVIEPCRPWGRVRLQGETWQARADGAAERGALVRVRSVEGLTLHVEAERALAPEVHVNYEATASRVDTRSRPPGLPPVDGYSFHFDADGSCVGSEVA